MIDFKLIFTWGERLLELLCLVGIRHAERVEVLGAADLELGDTTSLHDLNRPCVLAARSQEEVLDLMNLLGLKKKKSNKEIAAG